MENKIQQSGMVWLSLAVAILVADLVTKFWVLATFNLYDSVAVLPVFNLTYVRNYGAAFSFLHDAGGWQRWMFGGIAIVVSGLLLYWLRTTPKEKWWPNTAYCMILGGALGNLFDRLVHGYVVDWLDFYWGSSHFPAFNIADVGISVGAFMLIVEAFFEDRKEKQK